MNKQFVRIGKANGGIFQYRRVLDENGKLSEKLWAVDYRDERGKRARKMGFSTRADAVAFLNSNTMGDGPLLAPEKVTFHDALKSYRLGRDRNGKAAQSYYHLERFAEIFGEVPVRKISSARVEAALERIVKDHGLGLSTRNRALAQLSGLFSFAMKRRWIKEHPTRFGRVERYSVDNHRERWLRPNEIQALVDKAPEIGLPHLAPIIAFAASTGKRMGEIIRLRRSDYTTDALGRPTVWIADTKNGKPEAYPLEGAALEIIKKQAAKATSPSAYLFPGATGASALHAVVRNFRKVVEAVAADNPDWKLTYGRGKDSITFHSLRHSFATIGHAAGMTEKMLMQTGNWRSRVMIDRYVHRDDDAVRVALGKVGELVLGKFGKAEEKKSETA